MVLPMSAFSIRCLLTPCSEMFRRFVNRARVGDEILDLCRLLIALAILDALCWIIYVMDSLMVSISSSYCSVSNRFLNSSWNSTSLILFLWHLLFVASWSYIFPFYFYVQYDVAHNQSVVTCNVELVDDCYVFDDVWHVC